jgi:hypothetical protein
LSTVIGLPRHGHQNSKKIGDEIPAPRSLLPAPCSPLPAHVLAFPSPCSEMVSEVGMQGCNMFLLLLVYGVVEVLCGRC